MENKNLIKVIVIVFLSLVVVGLSGYVVYDKMLNNNSKNSSKNDVPNQSNLLTKDEALKEGKKLYDKATEIYETWLVVPYCGVKLGNMSDDRIESFGDSGLGNDLYYRSDFSSLDGLKNHLKQWLSDDIVNNKIKKTKYNYVEDLSLLSNEEYGYVDYVFKDNKLYCRLQTGKGILSYYHSYNIKVDNIEKDKITYTITSAYIKNPISDEKTSCSLDNPTACSEKDLEYKDTKFVIQKNNAGKFVVSEYTLHV